MLGVKRRKNGRNIPTEKGTNAALFFTNSGFVVHLSGIKSLGEAKFLSSRVKWVR
jgi:hypothetical protein